VNEEKTRAIKNTPPAIDLGMCKNLFSEKTMVMVIMCNYKIMPALTRSLQGIQKKSKLKE